VHLSEKISDDYKEALKSGDKDRVSILRMVKAAIKNKEIEKRSPVSDEEISAILRSYVKRAHESIEQFSKAGRIDLAEKEKKELAIIQSYLPQQINEDEIRVIIKDAINETGAAGAKDMGKVMKAVMSKTKGLADGKLVNNLVKEMLETTNAA
jgi:uncharacterized protein YqeY